MHPDHSPTDDLAAGLWRSAAGVLDANWAGDHTVPSPWHPRRQGSRDTAFAAIGLAYVNPRRAWRDLRSLFEAQRPDGRVPHVVRPAGTPASGLVHQPLHAIAAWEVYRHASAHGADAVRQARTELEWLYPRLVAAQEYLTGHRDAGGAGLAAIVHPWESEPGDAPEELVPAAIVHPGESAPEELAPAAAYRDGGHSDAGLLRRHSFVVECPGFNAILAGAELALAQIAGVLGLGERAPQHREAARRITRVLAERLWDPRTLSFHARDVRTGELDPARRATGLLPLMLPDLPPHQVLAIMVTASAGLPVPDGVQHGPVRIPVNWLLRRGMLVHGFRHDAENLRRALLRLVHRNGHHESHHPSGGGLGAPAGTATAAVCLDLLADRSAPAYARMPGAPLGVAEPGSSPAISNGLSSRASATLAS